MYIGHFGLTEPPFSITPDPRYLYMSEAHREALAHLLYGIGEGGGFVQLTGEVGTGKTTLCRCLLEQLPARVDVALHPQPEAHGRRASGRHLRRASHSLSGRHHQPEGVRRRAPPPPARRARARPPHRADHRRGSGPRPGRARADPAPHQPRDHHGEAPPDHPHRPAGAHPHPRARGPAPARAASHRALSSPAFRRARHAGLYRASPGGGGREGKDRERRGRARGASRLPRHPPADQCHLRPRAARGLQPGPPPRHRLDGPAGGGRGPGRRRAPTRPFVEMGGSGGRRGGAPHRHRHADRPGQDRPERWWTVRPVDQVGADHAGSRVRPCSAGTGGCTRVPKRRHDLDAPGVEGHARPRRPWKRSRPRRHR